jgi:hypothetical protein
LLKISKVLTTKGRDRIAEGNFALSGRRYPIHDVSHARNALARVVQHGTPGEKAQVRSAVKNKYPGIEQEKGAEDKKPKRAFLAEVRTKKSSTTLASGEAGRVLQKSGPPEKGWQKNVGLLTLRHKKEGSGIEELTSTSRALNQVRKATGRGPLHVAHMYHPHRKFTGRSVTGHTKEELARNVDMASREGFKVHPHTGTPPEWKKKASAATALLETGTGAVVGGLAGGLLGKKKTDAEGKKKRFSGKGAIQGAIGGGLLSGIGGQVLREGAANKAFDRGVKQFGRSSPAKNRMAEAAMARPWGIGAQQAANARVGNPVPIPKRASLCEQIAGTLNESDFGRFNSEFEDPAVRSLVEKSAMVQAGLHRLTSQPVVSAEKLASAARAASQKPSVDVIQVVPNGYGYTVKFSAAPENVAPQQAEMSAQQAQQALPPEALQAADQQGAATMTGVQAEPDPMEEAPPAPIEGFGLYKVYESGTGRQIVGFVIPGLFDPRSGQPSPMSIFINGGQYALQPSIVGTLVGMNFNLPYSESIRGLGLFYKTNGKALMATLPYNIISEVTVEGRNYYSATDPNTGEELQITISEGLKKPVATSPAEIVIPSDFQFLALDNPVELEGGEQADTMAQAKQAALPTMMEIRSWEGGCRLDGPVFEKVGSGEYDWIDGLFWMAAAGVPQNLGIGLLEKAASAGHAIRIYGCRPLSPVSETEKAASAEAEQDMLNTWIPQRYCLLKEAAVIGEAMVPVLMSMEGMDKEAAAMVGTDSVDAVLSLNFINPENVSTFLENLPQLEKAATKIASLVLATQLGLHAIPKTAATRAMFALEDVINGLKTLQEHKI